VAVDPTSPFTGGALLGDRVRMRDLATDPGVFVRSMAARGALGGLAHTTAAVVQLMDAAGYEVILIETVGAGQSEVDIVRLAHTTLVIEAPGLGDDIQAIKAGILEIADILVVNKADQPGVENTERALMSMLEMEHHGFEGDPTHWIPPVLRSIASRKGPSSSFTSRRSKGHACNGTTSRPLGHTAASTLSNHARTMRTTMRTPCRLDMFGFLPGTTSRIQSAQRATDTLRIPGDADCVKPKSRKPIPSFRAL